MRLPRALQEIASFHFFTLLSAALSVAASNDGVPPRVPGAPGPAAKSSTMGIWKGAVTTSMKVHRVKHCRTCVNRHFTAIRDSPETEGNRRRFAEEALRECSDELKSLLLSRLDEEEARVQSSYVPVWQGALHLLTEEQEEALGLLTTARENVRWEWHCFEQDWYAWWQWEPDLALRAVPLARPAESTATVDPASATGTSGSSAAEPTPDNDNPGGPAAPNLFEQSSLFLKGQAGSVMADVKRRAAARVQDTFGHAQQLSAVVRNYAAQSACKVADRFVMHRVGPPRANPAGRQRPSRSLARGLWKPPRF